MIFTTNLFGRNDGVGTIFEAFLKFNVATLRNNRGWRRCSVMFVLKEIKDIEL